MIVRLVAVAALVLAAPALASPIDPGAIRVIDGDTIEARGVVFRLVGFDTPKVGRPPRDVIPRGSVGEWGTVFGDPVVATAILDRLLHHSHVKTSAPVRLPPLRDGRHVSRLDATTDARNSIAGHADQIRKAPSDVRDGRRVLGAVSYGETTAPWR
jgi:hypothetical protein